MPIYCYTNKKIGCTVERVYKMGCAPNSIRVDGKRFVRDIAAEHAEFVDTPGAYPYYSDAMGVHPSQVPQAAAELKKCGLSSQWSKDGGLLITDRKYRKAAGEAIGLYDRNGGYGDPRRLNRVHVDERGDYDV